MIKLHPALRRGGWRVWELAALVALPALAIAVTWGAWTDIVRIARQDEEASHIILVPIVAAWLFWVRRRRLRLVRRRGLLTGTLLIALGWAMSYYGYTHAMQAAWHLGAVLMVVGAILSVLGVDVLLRFLPVFAVLVFLVPVPGSLRLQIAGPLQTATAEATRVVLELAGLPITRSGNLLTINGVEVRVAEACNGMRMVFALLLVSYAFAFGTPLRTYVRVLIVAISPITAILANVVRMVPTASLFGYADVDVARFFHDHIAGWAMLVLALLALFGLVRLMRWALLPVTRYPLAYEYC